MKSGTDNAYGLLVLLTLTNALNFVDRNLLAGFANFIKPDLGLSDTEFGLLTGLMFLIFYAVAGLFMGTIADLSHRPRLIAGAIAVWSLLTAASGAARGFVSLAIPRAFIGIGESALTPSAMSLLADRFSPAAMGRVTGIYYMGVPIGTGLGLLVAGYLGPLLGWRNCFYFLGGFGLIFAALMLTVREPRTGRGMARFHPVSQLRQMVLLGPVLRQSPALVAVMTGGALLHMAVGAAQFDQLWFVNERGFERAEIARLAGYVTMAAGICGNIFGGFVGDWWNRRMKSGRPMLLCAMMAVLVPLSIIYRLAAPDAPLYIFGMGLGVFQLAAFYGPTFSTVQELSPPNARATVTAFYILCLNVLGLGLGITATGWVVDHLRNAGFDQPYTAAMLIFISISALAIPAFYFAGRGVTREREKRAAAPAA